MATWNLSYYMQVVQWSDHTMSFDEKPVIAKMKAIKNAGMGFVGIDGINLLEKSSCDIYSVISDFRKRLTEMDLKVSSLHFAGPTFAPLEKEQDSVRKNMLENIAAFSKWEPSIFVIHAGWIWGASTNERITSDYENQVSMHGENAVIETIAANLKEMAQNAKKHAIKLAIENIFPPFPLRSKEKIGLLLEKIGEENVGYCLDSGHAHTCGESVSEWVRFCGDRLLETHFHDNRGDGRDEHLPVGFGTIDWPGVIKALDEINFSGPVTFETGGWPMDDMTEGYRAASSWWHACERLEADLRLKEQSHSPKKDA